MSSPSEETRDSRIFSAPGRPRRPWLKAAAAFAAGVACTVVATTFIAGTGRVSEQTRISQRTPASEPAATVNPQPAPNAEPASAPPQRVSEPEPERNASIAPPPAAEAAPAASGAEAKPNADIAANPSADTACERQTWPYVSHECSAADANGRGTIRSVRVITTDRTAPAKVVTVAPPLPAPRVTDGSSVGAVPQLPGGRATDGSAGQVSVASREQADQSPAGDIPMPRPKPDSLSKAASLPAAERQMDRQTERQMRRNGFGYENASNREPRRVKENGREAEEGRGVRRIESGDDADGYAMVRTYRKRDGRRLSTDEKQEERAPAREERPGLPLPPFFFNPAATGN